MNKWTPPRKAGGIPRVSTRFSLSTEKEQAYAGRDNQTRLARPRTQARTGTGNEQDWQPYPVDPYSAESNDHAYIHTYTTTKKGEWRKISYCSVLHCCSVLFGPVDGCFVLPPS